MNYKLKVMKENKKIEPSIEKQSRDLLNKIINDDKKFTEEMNDSFNDFSLFGKCKIKITK